jgi:hypothetical protein
MALAIHRRRFTLQTRVLYRPVHVIFLTQRVALNQAFLLVFRFSPIRIIPPVLYTHHYLNSQMFLVGCMFLLMLHFFSEIRVKIHTKEPLVSPFPLIK